MALDIREGDLLVVSGEEYPIRSCAGWKWKYARRGARRLMTETATTKRAPSVVNGKRGAPSTYLTGLPCMPLDPVDPEVRQRMALETPHEILQTTIDGGDYFYVVYLEELKR